MIWNHNCVDVDLYALSEPVTGAPLVLLDELQYRFPSVCWTPRISGVAVPVDVAVELDRLILLRIH